MNAVPEWAEWVRALGPTATIILGIAGVWLAHRYALHRQEREFAEDRKGRTQEREDLRRDISSAFLGEIEAVFRLIEYRQYPQEYIKFLQQSKGHAEPRGAPAMKIRENYFVVYEKNVDKIGLLPAPLPQQISTLYTVFKALKEDLTTLAEAHETAAGDELFRFVMAILDTYKQCCVLGLRVVQGLTKEIESQRGTILRDPADELLSILDERTKMDLMELVFGKEPSPSL